MKKNNLAQSIAEVTKVKYITEEERGTLKHELAERMKDLVYINAERRASEALANMGDFLNLSSDYTFEVTYKLKFCAGDFQQILARSRRK